MYIIVCLIMFLWLQAMVWAWCRADPLGRSLGWIRPTVETGTGIRPENQQDNRLSRVRTKDQPFSCQRSSALCKFFVFLLSSPWLIGLGMIWVVVPWTCVLKCGCLILPTDSGVPIDDLDPRWFRSLFGAWDLGWHWTRKANSKQT